MTKKLENIRLAVTRKCPFNCYYCHNEGTGAEDSFDRKHTLDVDDYIYLSDILINEMGTTKFTLTGGDPFLLDEVELLGRRISKKNLRVKIISRGAPIVEKIKKGELKADDFDHFCISIDTLNPERFEYITRVSRQLLDLNLQAVKMLKKIGARVRIHTVIPPDTDPKEILKVINFAKDNNVESVKLFEVVDRDTILEPYMEELLYKIGILDTPVIRKPVIRRYDINYKGLTLTPTRCSCNSAIFNGEKPDDDETVTIDAQGRANSCIMVDIHTSQYTVQLYNEIKYRDSNSLLKKLKQIEFAPCPLIEPEEKSKNKFITFGQRFIK